MDRKFTPFPHVQQRSQLLMRPSTDHLPSVDEILAYESEVKAIQTRTAERVSIAEANLATLERLTKKMREKEKLKIKSMVKTKRESTAPSDIVDLTMDAVPQAGPSAPAPSASTSASAIAPNQLTRPSKNNSLLDPNYNNKKKKRRRESTGVEELEDADMAPPPAQKPRKATPQAPALAPVASTSTKIKIAPASGGGHSKTNASGYRIAEDFSLPNRTSIPARPKLLAPIPPGPRHTSEVMDDFTKLKQPAKQEPIHQFHASVEPYTRPLREEDLAFLDYNGDEKDPFLIPALGRHYLEVWEEEDALFEQREPRSGIAPQRQPVPPLLPAWSPALMCDADLTSEQHGFGPLAERLVGGLLVDPNVKADTDPASAAGLDPWKGEPRPAPLNVGELEERMRKELLSVGLLTEEEPDFSHAEDDQIVSELRTCQRLLRDQMAINQARKARLLEIMQDRVAYQEFLDSKESIERNVLAAFAKLQKPAKSATANTSKKKKSASAARDEGPLPHPAVAGLGLTADGTLVVPDALKKLVDVRGDFVRAFGAALEQREREAPGSVYGLPTSSVYAGLDLPKDPDPGKRAR
ncbi:hypothetical protein AURDEDRAFT_183243 [Auricularia subglabra TFB-10046 SS5]|nr:hypothetical protein AURDEDRAFT_183243 [Auricularia subglabra TFB-10046 SS5]